MRRSKDSRNFPGLFTVITLEWIKRREMVNEMNMVFREKGKWEEGASGKLVHALHQFAGIHRSWFVSLLAFSLCLSLVLCYIWQVGRRESRQRGLSALLLPDIALVMDGMNDGAFSLYILQIRMYLGRCGSLMRDCVPGNA